MRMLAAIALALAIITSGLLPPAVSARQAAPDLDAAAEAAQTYLDLAVQGNFNGLFDYLHPDVLDEVPRSVGLAIFEGIYGATQPDPARIGQPDPVSFTWPVNGETYDAVAVPYEQEATNTEGQRETVQSLMYLALFDGQYRWFLGNSRAFVAEAIARFAPPPPSEQPGDIAAVLDLVVGDLDQFYATTFDGTQVRYVSPGVTVVAGGQVAMTGCGPAQPGFWAFYCPADATVYLDQPFLQELEQGYGDFAAAYVVGHEWAHHVQTIAGLERTEVPEAVNEVYSIELELQADCLAGIWSRDMDARAFLDLRDLAEASTFIFQRLGDPDGVGPFEPQAHGTGEERLEAYSNGYDGGFTGCEITGLSPVR
ncbi:MAG: neutral zinc metallopeptidase [Chloroflexia bacterium]|nr:neutral zinc metallopeptidase [Chloroflexia bacterium]